MLDIVTFNKKEVINYLDNVITRWKEAKSNNKSKLRSYVAIEFDYTRHLEDNILTSSCYIDAFQSVRMSLFGELLPKNRG